VFNSDLLLHLYDITSPTDCHFTPDIPLYQQIYGAPQKTGPLATPSQKGAQYAIVCTFIKCWPTFEFETVHGWLVGV